MIQAPAVDGRRVESFFAELRRYAPNYTPDLNLSDEQGAGLALMRIFAQLAETISVRLDQTPHKHFVAFLDRLGISLLPARAARAAVTFRLASGLEEVIRVPAGTRVTAPGKEDDIPFETTGELVAIPGALTAAYGADPQKDQIYGPPRDFLKQESRTPTELSYKIQSFVENQSNRLQLDHTTDLEPGTFIRIGCKEKNVIRKKEEGGFVTLSEPVKQAFADGTIVTPIKNFEVFNGINLQEHSLYLGHSGLFTVKEEVEITVTVDLKNGATGAREPLKLLWQFWTKDENATPPEEEHWKDFDLKSDKTIGLTTSGKVVLRKPGGFEIKPRTIGGTESRWIRAKLDGNLPVGTALPEIETIEVGVSTGTDLANGNLVAKSIKADQGFYNATPLDVKIDPAIGFFPFGTEPRQFDQFYIASEEAFSKREAQVTLNFALDLQTLAAPSVTRVPNGIRAYSIGLRQRLYELDVTTGGWLNFGNPAEATGSAFMPIEDSTPAAVSDAQGIILVYVNTRDAQASDDPTNKIWAHIHNYAQTSGTWTDLGAPTPAQNRILFSPVALRTPGWPHASRVFVVGSDGKLYSRGHPGGTDWDSHGSPGPKLDSPPFVVAVGAEIFVFVNGEGTVHWLRLPVNLNGTWKSLTPDAPTTFAAAYRPFAQPFVESGTSHAKIFTFAFADANDKTTGSLFECDTRDEDTTTHEFPWIDLGQPTGNEVTDTAPEAHAPNGYLEDPKALSGGEGRHIFLRGADNRLYERMDGAVLTEPRWEDRSRLGDPNLRDSPAVQVDVVGGVTTIQVFSASGRNSLVRWILEANTISGLNQANAEKQGVLLDTQLASNENHEYDNLNLKITYADASVENHLIQTYDGSLKLARLATPWNNQPDSSSECQIGPEDLDFARDFADEIFVVHNSAPPTDDLSANPIYLRSSGSFVPVDFYSRVTGMLSLDPNDFSSTLSIYSVLSGVTPEFQSPQNTGSVPDLSWEYWNGRGWLSLAVTDGTRNLLSDGRLTIANLPSDIAATEVAGQESFWIRARLVGGDYGRETFKIVGTAPNQTLVPEKSSLRPPKVRSLSISYTAQPVAPEACLALNNLNYLDQTAAAQTEGSHFRPFETLEDQSPTLFFGFDKPFQTGPVRLLLDAAERNYDESQPPEFEWSFRKDRKWKKLDADDGSVALTRQGILTLSASEELTRETRFGESLFWIKGTLRTDRVEIEGADEDESADPPGPCDDQAAELSKTSARVSAATANYPLPLLRGIFPNTVWAIHGETIIEEIVGSGDGEPDQPHKIQHADVLEGEDIRIRETLSAEEREQIERERGRDSVVDREDLGGTWVRWTGVKSLFDCGPDDRCYEIDRATGDLRFGDGTHGDVPPAGVDNIRAFRYRTGGGSVGNVAANKIEALATAVEGIESVFNPTPSGGGSDKADTNAMLTMGPRRISHRDRAVSAEDFEELAYEASREVAKVRCLSTTNLQSGNGSPDPCDPGRRHQALKERGWVSLIIVPNSRDPRPCPSLELRRAVKDYLRERAPSVIAAARERIVVRPPDYVIVSIRANIFVPTLEHAAKAETEARTKLEEFLHPLRGGPDGKGWEFGRSISKSDVFALLERIADIDRVEGLSFQFRGGSNPDRVEIGPNELPASGEHVLAIKKA